MKHVFVIHSHITFLVAKEVIKKEKLNKKDVIVYLSRNYNLLEEISSKVFYMPKVVINSKNLFLNYVNIISYKKKFNQIKSKYYLYLPHSKDLKFASLIANKNCIGYSYIEEGLAVYMDENFGIRKKMNVLKRAYKIFRYGSSVQLMEFNYRYSFFNLDSPKFITCYGLSEQAFMPFPDKKILNLDFKTKQEGDFDCLIILDSLVVYNIISHDEFFDLLKNVILKKVKSSNYRNIAYKLHPEHRNSKKGIAQGKIIDDFFSNQEINITKLSSDFIVEVYLMKNKADVYSYVSSVGVYASIFGNQSFSLFKRIMKEKTEKIKIINNKNFHHL